MFDLYSEIILDHFKNPQNKGTLPNPTGEAKEYNPLCGDKISIQIQTDANNKITAIKWDGEGCAISQAATDLLTKELLNKTIQEIKDLENDFVYDLIKVPISPARVKCALLGLVTAKKAAILSQHQHQQQPQND